MDNQAVFVFVVSPVTYHGELYIIRMSVCAIICMQGIFYSDNVYMTRCSNNVDLGFDCATLIYIH